MDKKDKCKKGKPCGKACISQSRICRKDTPGSTSKSLKKTAEEIEAQKTPTTATPKPPTPTPKPPATTTPKPPAPTPKPKAKKKPKVPLEEQLKTKADAHLKKLKRAAIAAHEKTYINNRNKYLELKKMLEDVGVKVSTKDPPPWEKIAPAAKALKKAMKDKAAFEKIYGNDKVGSNASALLDKAKKRHETAVKNASKWLRDSYLEKGVGLSPLTTAIDYKSKLAQSRKFYSKKIEDMHNWISKLMGPTLGGSWGIAPKDDKEKGLIDRLKTSLLAAMPKEDIKEAYSAIRRFTGITYTSIRNAQNGREPNDKYLAMGKAIDKLLSRPELIRPEVEKFRGKGVSNSQLSSMIAAAKIKGTYIERAINSWSTDLEVGQKFSRKTTYDRPEQVILRTVNKRGVPIESVTVVKNEFEVMTPSNVEYRFINYRPITVGYETFHMFDVEEL